MEREREWQHILFICHELGTDVNYVFPFFYITKFISTFQFIPLLEQQLHTKVGKRRRRLTAGCIRGIRSMWKWPDKKERKNWEKKQQPTNAFALVWAEYRLTIRNFLFIEFNILLSVCCCASPLSTWLKISNYLNNCFVDWNNSKERSCNISIDRKIISIIENDCDYLWDRLDGGQFVRSWRMRKK